MLNLWNQEFKSVKRQDKRKAIVTKGLKKACHTRWLFLGHVVNAIHEDLEAVMQTLQALERENIIVLWTVRENSQPKVRWLHLHFQKYASHTVPAEQVLSMAYAKQQLQAIADQGNPLKQLREDFKSGGRLSMLDLSPPKHHFQQMESLLKKYVASLITNINHCFADSVSLLKLLLSLMQ